MSHREDFVWIFELQETIWITFGFKNMLGYVYLKFPWCLHQTDFVRGQISEHFFHARSARCKILHLYFPRLIGRTVIYIILNVSQIMRVWGENIKLNKWTNVKWKFQGRTNVTLVRKKQQIWFTLSRTPFNCKET